MSGVSASADLVLWPSKCRALSNNSVFWTQDWEMGNSFNSSLPYQIILVFKVTQTLDLTSVATNGTASQWYKIQILTIFHV